MGSFKHCILIFLALLYKKGAPGAPPPLMSDRVNYFSAFDFENSNFCSQVSIYQ